MVSENPITGELGIQSFPPFSATNMDNNDEINLNARKRHR